MQTLLCCRKLSLSVGYDIHTYKWLVSGTDDDDADDVYVLKCFDNINCMMFCHFEHTVCFKVLLKRAYKEFDSEARHVDYLQLLCLSQRH